MTSAKTTSKSSSSSSKNLSKPKTAAWYMPAPSHISLSMRNILETYSQIQPDEVIPHILSIRDKAYTHHPVPFIGLLSFTTPSLPQTPSYTHILTSLRSGHTLLDIGCGLGQDLRTLHFDGAPLASLTGIDTSPALINLSYSLFNDSEIFTSPLLTASIFEISKNHSLTALKRSFDFANLSLFLHLFDWEMQVRVLKNVVRLLKEKTGVMVTGCCVGNLRAGEVVSVVGKERSKRRSFRHDVRSFERLWGEVGGEWRVWGWLEEEDGKEWDEEGTRMLRFEVVRV